MSARRAESVARSQTARGDRITVTLIPKVRQDLQLLQERTSLSTTDLANRAITLYEFFDAQLREGHDFIARDSATGSTRLVRLLDAPGGQVMSAGPAHDGRGRAGLLTRLWRQGRHRRPQPALGRPRIPVVAAWLPYLACLTGQIIAM